MYFRHDTELVYTRSFRPWMLAVRRVSLPPVKHTRGHFKAPGGLGSIQCESRRTLFPYSDELLSPAREDHDLEVGYFERNGSQYPIHDR